MMALSSTISLFSASERIAFRALPSVNSLRSARGDSLRPFTVSPEVSSFYLARLSKFFCSIQNKIPKMTISNKNNKNILKIEHYK